MEPVEALLTQQNEEQLLVEKRKNDANQYAEAVCKSALLWQTQQTIENLQHKRRFIALLPFDWWFDDNGPRPSYCHGDVYIEYVGRAELLARIKQFGGKWKKHAMNGSICYERTEPWNGFAIKLLTGDTPPGCSWKTREVTRTERVLDCQGAAQPDIENEVPATPDNTTNQ